MISSRVTRRLQPLLQRAGERTPDVCGCRPVAATICLIVAPSGRSSMAISCNCFVPSRVLSVRRRAGALATLQHRRRPLGRALSQTRLWSRPQARCRARAPRRCDAGGPAIDPPSHPAGDRGLDRRFEPAGSDLGEPAERRRRRNGGHAGCRGSRGRLRARLRSRRRSSRSRRSRRIGSAPRAHGAEEAPVFVRARQGKGRHRWVLPITHMRRSAAEPSDKQITSLLSAPAGPSGSFAPPEDPRCRPTATQRPCSPRGTSGTA